MLSLLLLLPLLLLLVLLLLLLLPLPLLLLLLLLRPWRKLRPLQTHARRAGQGALGCSARWLPRASPVSRLGCCRWQQRALQPRRGCGEGRRKSRPGPPAAQSLGW